MLPLVWKASGPLAVSAELAADGNAAREVGKGRRYRRPRTDLQRQNRPTQYFALLGFAVGTSARSVLRSAGLAVPAAKELTHAHLATGRMVKATGLLTRRRRRRSRPMDRACRPDRRRRPGRISIRYGRAGRDGVATDRQTVGGGGGRSRARRSSDLVLDQPERYEAAGAGIGAAWRETLG